MKSLLVLIFCIASGLSFGQVTGVDYLMKYNCETNQYDVSIVVLSGSTTSIVHRAQFNSQISIVIPTGKTVEITDHYMPLQNNQNYTGTIPINWTLRAPVVSPAAQPENDFYSITPQLSPAAFYNDLQENDIVTLFSFTADSLGVYDENIRFFDNDTDPEKSDPGMGGGNFSNGFTIGGLTQIYHGNQVISCITDVDEVFSITANVFPNPFQHKFTIEVPNDTRKLYILGLDRNVYYQTTISSQKFITINTRDFASGVYFVKMEMNSGISTSSRIVKL